MPANVKIAAMTDGVLNKLMLADEGGQKISCRTQTWAAGANLSAAPDTDHVIELTGCRAAPDGSILSGQTKMMVWTPSVVVTLADEHQTGGDYTATVDISHAWPQNSTVVHQIGPADFAAAIQFVKDCHLPNLA